MHFYPSEAWLDAYAERLDESDALDDLSVGVIEDFAGSIRLVIADLPLAETTVGDLPPSALAELPDQVTAGLADVPIAELPGIVPEPARAGLPGYARELIDQIERNVSEDALHVLLELDAGDCVTARVLESPDRHDPDFTIRGSYYTWREIVDGRPSVSAMLTGDLRLEGNSFQRLHYMTMFQLLGDIASDVETTHLFGGRRTAATNVLIDEAVRHPVSVHRFADRQAKRALNFL